MGEGHGWEAGVQLIGDTNKGLVDLVTISTSLMKRSISTRLLASSH